MIQFTVYGSPIAQPRQRHRVVEAHGRVFSTNYTPKTAPVTQWKSDVKAAALNAMENARGIPTNGGFPLWDGPIFVQAVFYLPRPASRSRNKDPDGPVPHITKPDTDNLIKAVKDALSGVIFRDDKQVCDERVRKFYHEKDKGPRCEIWMEQI